LGVVGFVKVGERRVALGVARDDLDPFLGGVEFFLAVLYQAKTLFVASDECIKRQRADLHLGDDGVDPFDGRLQARRFGFRFLPHGFITKTRGGFSSLAFVPTIPV